MIDVTKYSLTDLAKMVANKQVTSEQLVGQYTKQIKKHQSKNAVLKVFASSLQRAKEIDQKIDSGKPVGKLAGVPIIIKDNILFKDHKSASGSGFMKNFVSPYTSTVVKKLLQEDAIILGRANMDEFAMGSTNETSAFGATQNAIDSGLIAAGSSGGSAVAVALSCAAAALGTDTGGSVRQPASYNGVVGIKPTYGGVSRYGVVAYASSFDQVGPITKTVKDNALLLSVLAGKDENDQTTAEFNVPNYLNNLKTNISGLRVGLLKQAESSIKNSEHSTSFAKLTKFLESKGAEVVQVSVNSFNHVLPVYYTLSCAEAASNLARFDGVNYTTRSKDADNINEVFVKSRTEGFGYEIKKRIMFGNFVLSSENYETYYKGAKALQQQIAKEVEQMFLSCDVLLIPTTSSVAFELGKNNNGVSMYEQDNFTALANITGIPALSVPYAKGKGGLSLGVQILANKFNEQTIYNVAELVERDFSEVAK